MPDIASIPPTAGTAGTSAHATAVDQSKTLANFKIQPAVDINVPSTVSSSGTAGGSSRRFSYTKSWGEVSDTLRKKLRERLSALKESDDTSGEDDRVYRSDTGAESRDLTPESREKSPESGTVVSAVRQTTAEVASSSSPPSCNYLYGGGASCRQPGVAKLNRTGTAFLGVPLTPRVSRSVTPRRTPGSSLRSITPDRAEYRSLASFIRRSATPDRVLASRAGARGLPSPQANEDVSNNVTTSSSTPQQLQGRSDSGQRDPTEDDGFLDHGRQQNVEDDEKRIKSGAAQVERSADVEGLLVEDSVKKSLDLLDDSIENGRDVSDDRKNTSTKNGEDGSSLKSTCKVETVHVADNGAPETISLKNAESEPNHTEETGNGALSATSKCKDDANIDRTTPKTALTHFIEVTSLEDGMKRITYVENGVVLDVPAKVGNGRGTFSKKKCPPRAEVIVREEGEKRSPCLPAADVGAAVSNDAMGSPFLSKKLLKEAADKPSKTKSKSYSSAGIKHKKSAVASSNGSSTNESISKGNTRSLTQPLTIKTEASHYLDSSQHASVYCSPTSMAGASEASSAEASSLPSILEAGGGLLSQMSLLSVAETASLPEVQLPIPGAHTGAVPKKRTWRQLAERRDTQVVKFPKNRLRGQNPADVAVGSGVAEALVPDASRRRRSLPVEDGSSDVACKSESTAACGIVDSEINRKSKNCSQGAAAPRESRGAERRKRASGESTASRKSLEAFQGRDKTAQSSLRKNSSKNKTRPLPEEPDENLRERDIETGSKCDETKQMTDVADSMLDAVDGGPEVVPGGGTNLSTSSGVRSGIARGSVAKKQALYESIGEVHAQKSPAVVLGQPDHVGEHAEDGTTDSAPTQGSRLGGNAELERIAKDVEVMKIPTAGAVMAAGVEDADEDDEDQRVSVFRIRRSALEALRYRIPQTRDIVRTRFRSKELSTSNVDDVVGSTSPELPTSDWLQRDPPADVISDLPARDPASPSAALTDDGKHSLLQFAMLHFRDADEKYNMLRNEDGDMNGSLKHAETKTKKQKKKSKDDWTWREQVEMVKWSSQPLEVSLLKLETADMNRMSLECFLCIQRYMGDQPMAKTMSEVDCVYSILMSCHRSPALRDEVFCQLMRQTTSNKSHQSDSCQRGWRLFSIVAAYFACSDQLRPYLFKYLEVAAYDKRRGYHGTALVCLQNLRKTFRFGGRKNVPSIEEITAITAGRNSKRQIYRLPGGTERVINTKSTSVVQDIIEEICGAVRIAGGDEMDEFSLYCIVEGDTFTMPLAREEYILDVTTELQKNQQIFYLIFCRSVWYFPLRLDSDLYVEVVFNQITPDYLEGLLLVMPGETLQEQVVYDISRVAALLHRAADMQQVPTMKETKYLLPKAALMVRDIKPPQWVNMVQSNWQEVQDKTPMEAKSSVLEILESWPLFGSSFFAVSRVTESRETVEHILALNRGGVHFLDTVTHETLAKYPFSEVISTRKVKTEDGSLFLDMKYGNLMLQKVVRIQSDNAHEISRLIRQYISIEQKRRPTDPAVESGRDGQASR